MTHRDPRLKDFIGKTIADAEFFWNQWKFSFTDGTFASIEAENDHLAGPGLVFCDECPAVTPSPEAYKKWITEVSENDYELLRSDSFHVNDKTYTLELYDTHLVENYKQKVAYCLFQSMKPLFYGSDFFQPIHANELDSFDTVESLMSFLTLKPGDTDPEYFKDYTPELLVFCEEDAEMLQMEVMARAEGNSDEEA